MVAEALALKVWIVCAFVLVGCGASAGQTVVLQEGLKGYAGCAT